MMKSIARLLIVFIVSLTAAALATQTGKPMVEGFGGYPSFWDNRPFDSPFPTRLLDNMLFDSPLPTPLPSPTPSSPSSLAQIALQYVAAQEGTYLAELSVVNEHNRRYTLTGRNFQALTVLSHRTGHFYELLVNPDNESIVDRTTIEHREHEAYQARYGKLEPVLQAILEEQGQSDEVKVMIWLTPIDLESILTRLAASYPKMKRDSERPMDVDDPVLAVAVASDYEELLAQAHLVKAQDLVASLQSRGYEVTAYRSIPAVVATLPQHLIEQVSQRSDVSRVYLTGKSIQPALDFAIPTDRVPAVWARGIEGNGIQIAIVEDGKVENHPWVNVIATRPIPLGVADHATWSAGIAAGNYPTYKGVAPAAEIVSAPTYGATNDVVAAIDWARGQGADIINSSYSVNSEDDDMHELDRAYDYLVRYWHLSMPTAAGDQQAGNHTATPGKAYNVITVGAFEDQNDSNWSNDSIWDRSAYQNPKTDDARYGDREKPEIVAVGADVTVLGTNSQLHSIWGTSAATPQVSGLVALLMQRHNSLRFWPEAVKTIIMASAIHNIEGPSIMRADGYDDKDGAGGIVADLADQIAMARGEYGSICFSPCWWGESISNSSFPVGTYRYYQFYAPADARIRVAIAWDSAPAGDYAANPLKTNLNLLIVDPDWQSLDTVGGYSASWDNSYEIVEFMSRKAGTYKIGVSKVSATEESNNLGIAWTKQLMPYKVNLPLILTDY